MLVELLRPAGPELARRWLAALLLAPASDRRAIVEEVERRMVAEYAESPARGDAAPGALHLRGAPVQRDGYVEETVRTYAPAGRPGAARKKQRGA